MTVIDCQTETVSGALVAQRLAQHRDDHVTQAGLTLCTLDTQASLLIMTVVDCQTETVSDALVAQRLAQYRDDHVTQAGLTLSTLDTQASLLIMTVVTACNQIPSLAVYLAQCSPAYCSCCKLQQDPRHWRDHRAMRNKFAHAVNFEAGSDWPLCHCAMAQAPPSTNACRHPLRIYDTFRN